MSRFQIGVPKPTSFLIWQYYPKWSQKASGETSKLPNLECWTCIRCEIFRRFRIWRCQVLILSVKLTIPKMVLDHVRISVAVNVFWKNRITARIKWVKIFKKIDYVKKVWGHLRHLRNWHSGCQVIGHLGSIRSLSITWQPERQFLKCLKQPHTFLHNLSSQIFSLILFSR